MGDSVFEELPSWTEDERKMIVTPETEEGCSPRLCGRGDGEAGWTPSSLGMGKEAAFQCTLAAWWQSLGRF